MELGQAESVARVLVVENDDVLRELLVATLAGAGYTARSVADGAAALAALEGWSPDLVLLDLMLPVMDGLTFLRRRQRLAGLADVPVLVLTARPDHEDVLDGLGAAGVLRKPCSPDDLLASILALARPRPDVTAAG